MPLPVKVVAFFIKLKLQAVCSFSTINAAVFVVFV